jgi:hypothetical protein
MIYQTRISISVLAAISVGMALLALPISSRVQAAEQSGTDTNSNAPAAQTTSTPDQPNSQSAPITRQLQSSRNLNNPSQNDSVRVEDVSPEYCRSYFPPFGSVSLQEYQQNIQLCIYGPDRGLR